MKSVEPPSKTVRRHLFACLVVGLGLFAAKNAFAAEYYVATTGADSNPGTLASPFATLQKGNTAAAAGDTVWLRGGTYSCTTQITLSKSGTSDSNRTKVWAYPSEVPVLDFSKYVSTNPAADVPAILVTGSWMHLKGLEIANGAVGASGDHSYSMLRTKNASNNTFEMLNIHHGFGPGLFIDTGNGGNLILNCDSHDNYDKDGSQGDGQNGDGFGVHYQTTGPSTVIRGCRTWVTSDDGYDFIYQEVPVTIENSWAIQAGYANGGATSPGSGNGNGFKIGSSGTGVRHIVQNCVAWKNKASGFYANHSSGGNTWYNNTSYQNGTQYNMLAATFASDGRTIATDGITLTGSKVHIMRNNIGFPNKNANMTGVDTSFNTWDLNITPAASDFASVSDTGCTGPREADGSLPAACNFMKLVAGSRLIDKGTDVGLPFVGAAPDLGAYEYGATPGTGGTTVGSGGNNGTGGNSGSGGLSGSGGSTGRGGSTGSGGTSGGGGSIRGDGSAGSGGSTRSDGSVGSGGDGGSGSTVTGTGGTSSAGASGGVAASGGAMTGAGGVAGPGGVNPGSGGNIAAGGGGTSGGNGTGPGGAAGKSGTGGATTGVAAGSSGCGCAVGSRSPGGGTSAFMLVGALALLAKRRRKRT